MIIITAVISGNYKIIYLCGKTDIGVLWLATEEITCVIYIEHYGST